MKYEDNNRGKLITEWLELSQEIADSEESEKQGRLGKKAPRTERELISAVLDTVRALVVVLDLQGRIVLFNKACEQTTGYAFDEVRGRHVWDVFLPAEEIEPVKAVFDRLGSGQLPSEHRNHWLTNEGIPRLIEWSNTVLLDDRGSVKYVIGTGIDVTEREWAEKRVEHLRLALRAIRNVNQLIIGEKDLDRLLTGICENLVGTKGYYNAWISLMDDSSGLVKVAEAGLGEWFLPMVERLERGELTHCGKRALMQSEVVLTDDPMSVCTDCPLSKRYVDRGGMTVRLEHGGRVYGLLSVSVPRAFIADEEERELVKEVAGDIAYALHNIDVEQERKLAEDKLNASEKRYRTIFETTGTATIIIEEDTTISLANTEFEELSGYSKAEVEGKKSWKDFVAQEDDLERMVTYHDLRRIDTNAAPRNYEFKFIDRKGVVKDIFATFAVIAGTRKSVGSFLNITKQKRDRDKIEHLNLVLRAIRNVNQLIIREKDLDRLFKRACENLVGTRGYHNAWIALTDESGGFVKTADAGLGDAFLPMVVRLREGKLPDCGRRALTESGVLSIKDPRATCIDCPLSEQYGGRAAIVVRLEHQGKVFGLLTASIPAEFVTDEEEQALFEEVANDIAFALHSLELEERQKQAEETLRESEKLASMGKLAAGIAHSIRNPLTSVKMRLFSLERSLELDPTQREDFNVISEEMRYIDSIVRNFLEFSRPPKLKMERTSPSVVVDKALQLLGDRIESYGVKVRLDRQGSLPEIWIDPGQLEEVMVNLLVNACEAMASGGSILIQEEGGIAEPLGEAVIIRVTDNGPGVPQSVIDRVFQPFFSTKDEGTGLGLNIATRIVEEHGGRLAVESQKGEGATFIITLPVKQERTQETT